MEALTSGPLPWILAGLAIVGALVAMRRPLGLLLRLLARAAVGMGVLVGFNYLGGLVGLSLGVNLVNAAVLAVLGAPGFGLLLMLNWALAV